MSVKVCEACGQQARCSDSRQEREYVRRRYVCPCGQRWTTAEFRVDRNAQRGTKISAFQEAMKKQALKESLQSLLNSLID